MRAPPAPRSESMAYPRASTSTYLSRLQFACRHNFRGVLATVAFLTILGFLASDALHDFRTNNLRGMMMKGGSSSIVSEHWGGAVRPGYFQPSDARMGSRQFHFAIVPDLDEKSKVADSRKPLFRSWLAPGTITFNSESKQYDIELEAQRELLTKHNEAGRGAEFSELSIFNDRLLTFDDRTGDVFEILNNEDGTESTVAPRFVITEGSGETDKGMKWEWSTVKDGELYMGSMGKEYTNSKNEVVNRNNLWIAVLDGNGQLRREDWTQHYNVVRKALNAEFPGYLIIEAVNWSDHLQKWVFLPRRVSSESYDENEDEKKGSNKVVLVSPDFSEAKVVDIQLKDKDPLKGFSSFAFVPGTNDEHAMAIRSVEENCTGSMDVCEQRSYLIIFNVLTGKVLSDELQYPEKLKFEGLEFVNLYTKAPPMPTLS